MNDLSKPLPFGLSRHNWPVLALIVVAVIAAVAPVDHLFSTFVRSWPQPVKWLLSRITDLGLSDWILIPALILFVISWGLAALMKGRGPKLPWLALLQMTQIWAFIFISVGLPGLIANIAKRFIGRGRPAVFDTDGSFAFHPLSNNWRFEGFPSGHTTTAFAFAMAVSFLQPTWLWPSVFIAALVGLSRVSVGMHYPTDVVGGVVLGILGAYLVRLVFAQRRWCFETLPGGDIKPRPLCAVQRLSRPRRRQAIAE